MNLPPKPVFIKFTCDECFKWFLVPMGELLPIYCPWGCDAVLKLSGRQVA